MFFLAFLFYFGWGVYGLKKGVLCYLQFKTESIAVLSPVVVVVKVLTIELQWNLRIKATDGPRHVK